MGRRVRQLLRDLRGRHRGACWPTGEDVVLVIDVQGARQVRQRGIETVGIFVLPPSAAILEQRLRGRSKDTEEQIRRRLDEAFDEVGEFAQYDTWSSTTSSTAPSTLASDRSGGAGPREVDARRGPGDHRDVRGEMTRSTQAGAPPRATTSPRGSQRASRGAGRHRRDVRVEGEVAHQVVAKGEQRRAERARRAMPRRRTCRGRSGSSARAIPPQTIRQGADEDRGTGPLVNASTAIVTAKSGAVPNATDAREEPPRGSPP